jgi:hypothetical protein
MGQPDQRGNRARKAGNAGMRNRHAAAEAGAAEHLALFQPVEHGRGIKVPGAREDCRQSGQDFGLVGCLDNGNRFRLHRI